VEPGVYLCEQCREEEGVALTPPPKPASDLEERSSRWPAWMPRPSPVQYHATIATVIVLVLVGLAVFAFLSHRGVGPFKPTDVKSRINKTTLIVHVTVENQGSKTSRANCRIAPVYDKNVGEPTDVLLTEEIPPGKSVSFTDRIKGVEAPPTGVQVSCS
jgi:hypothetical protein